MDDIFFSQSRKLEIYSFAYQECKNYGIICLRVAKNDLKWNRNVRFLYGINYEINILHTVCVNLLEQ